MRIYCAFFFFVFFYSNIYPKKILVFGGWPVQMSKGWDFILRGKLCHTLSPLQNCTHLVSYTDNEEKENEVCGKKWRPVNLFSFFFFLGALIKYHRCRLVGRYVYVSSRAYFAPFLNNNDYMGMRMGWCFESKLARKNQLL